MSTSLLHQELSTEKGQSCPPIPDSNPLNPKSPALRTTSNSTILNSPIETINVNTSSKATYPANQPLMAQHIQTPLQ